MFGLRPQERNALRSTLVFQQVYSELYEISNLSLCLSFHKEDKRDELILVVLIVDYLLTLFFCGDGWRDEGLEKQSDIFSRLSCVHRRFFSSVFFKIKNTPKKINTLVLTNISPRGLEMNVRVRNMGLNQQQQ